MLVCAAAAVKTEWPGWSIVARLYTAMRSLRAVVRFGTSAAAVMVAMVAPAVAQPSTPASKAGLAFELRLGRLWPQPPLILDRDETNRPSTNAFAIGGRFGYNFARPLGGRLGLHLVGDYAERGSTEYAEAGLGPVRREGHWFVVTPAVSVDLLKTSRIAASARAGPSVIGELTTFMLERSEASCSVVSGVYSCEGDFDNVCDLTAFETRCAERYRAALALGGGIRWHPHRTWPLSFGIDYSWLSPDQNVLVGTIGLWTRY
jgi:opacity protein-like surface antigen